MNKMETLRTYTGDQLALQKHIVEQINRQLNDEDMRPFTRAVDFLTRLEITLNSNVSSLEDHLEELGAGGSSLAVKSAITAMTGLVAGLFARFRHHPASKMLRDDYIALNVATMGYTMLHTTGLALNSKDTADVALEHLGDLTSYVMELNELVPDVVTHELLKEMPSIDLSIARQATHNTQAVWRHQHQ